MSYSCAPPTASFGSFGPPANLLWPFDRSDLQDTGGIGWKSTWMNRITAKRSCKWLYCRDDDVSYLQMIEMRREVLGDEAMVRTLEIYSDLIEFGTKRRCLTVAYYKKHEKRVSIFHVSTDWFVLCSRNGEPSHFLPLCWRILRAELTYFIYCTNIVF